MSKLSGKICIIGSDATMMSKFHNVLIKGLVANGNEVILLVPNEPNKKIINSLLSTGARVRFFPLARTGLNPISDIWTLIVLLLIMFRQKPDVVFAYTVKPVIYGMIASKLARVPRCVSLITGLGYAFTGQPRGGRRIVQLLVSFLYRQAFRYASVVIFQNSDDQRVMREKKILLHRTPSTVVDGCGVDTDKYHCINPPPDTSLIFLMVARVIADKGVREFVQAARIVRKLHPTVKFRLIGSLDSNPDAIKESEVRQWVNEGAIEWHGPVEQINDALCGSSVFVLPSYREGLPQSTIEALACGRAVITTDVPGCRETVIDSVTGFIVAPQSANALANACLRFVDEPALVRKFGTAARTVAVRRFAAKHVNTKMEELLNLPVVVRDR